MSRACDLIGKVTLFFCYYHNVIRCDIKWVLNLREPGVKLKLCQVVLSAWSREQWYFYNDRRPSIFFINDILVCIHNFVILSTHFFKFKYKQELYNLVESSSPCIMLITGTQKFNVWVCDTHPNTKNYKPTYYGLNGESNI